MTAIYIILNEEHYNILYARASSSYISSDQQHEGELEPVNCNYPTNTQITQQHADRRNSLFPQGNISLDYEEPGD